ncbi:MAG: hypothetical protein EHM67_08840 [Hyphomicrobiaceae bacterium]|nr:MAG: hypothetical protein EHM67_08840 [Hyphomicrobiaceae bacterium]
MEEVIRPAAESRHNAARVSHCFQHDNHRAWVESLHPRYTLSNRSARTGKRLDQRQFRFHGSQPAEEDREIRLIDHEPYPGGTRARSHLGDEAGIGDGAGHTKRIAHIESYRPGAGREWRRVPGNADKHCVEQGIDSTNAPPTPDSAPLPASLCNLPTFRPVALKLLKALSREEPNFRRIFLVVI